MDIAIRFIKALRLGLMLMFLALLLWIYAYLPETVMVGLGMEAPDDHVTMSRSAFFYLFLFAFVLINILLILYFNLVAGGREDAIPGVFNRSEKGRHRYVIWVGALHLVLDAFIIFTLLHFGLSNILEAHVYGMDWPLLVGPVMLAILLLILIFLMIVHRKKP